MIPRFLNAAATQAPASSVFLTFFQHVLFSNAFVKAPAFNRTTPAPSISPKRSRRGRRRTAPFLDGNSKRDYLRTRSRLRGRTTRPNPRAASDHRDTSVNESVPSLEQTFENVPCERYRASPPQLVSFAASDRPCKSSNCSELKLKHPSDNSGEDQGFFHPLERAAGRADSEGRGLTLSHSPPSRPEGRGCKLLMPCGTNRSP